MDYSSRSRVCAWAHVPGRVCVRVCVRVYACAREGGCDICATLGGCGIYASLLQKRHTFEIVAKLQHFFVVY